MASDDLNLRVRLQEARKAAKDGDLVRRSVGGIGTEADRSSRKLRSFAAVTASSRRGLTLTAGAALGAGGALSAGLAFGLKQAHDAYQETYKVGRQTDAVLKSTGGAANVTADQVSSLAGALMSKTGIDDEAIQSGENLLLTFRGIRNEVGKGNDIFNQATKASVDLGAAMGTDTRSAALQLGKALNDPAKGYSRLQRSGVTFTASQIKQIKTLQKSGDTLGAQKIILAELNKEFEGSAAAQGTSTEKLTQSWGNVMEAVGKAEQPVIDIGARWLTQLTDELGPAVDTFGDRVDRVMNSKKLNGRQKLDLLVTGAKTDFGPVADDLRSQVSDLHIGDEILPELKQQLADAHVGDILVKGFDQAAPVMADHAGQLGLRAAKGFGETFLHAGPWGKLALGLLLYAKFPGAFNAAGRAAGRQFGLGVGSGSKPTLATVGRTAGTTVAAETAEGAATHMPESFGARQGRLAKAGRGLGKTVGLAAAAVIGYEIADWLADHGSELLGGGPAAFGSASVAGKMAADQNPSVRKGREMARDKSLQAAQRAWDRQHPALARRSRAQSGGVSAPSDPDLIADLIAAGDPHLIPGSPGVPNDYDYRHPPARRTDRSSRTPLQPFNGPQTAIARNRGAAMTRPDSGRRMPAPVVNNHIYVGIDGLPVANNVAKHELTQAERSGRGRRPGG